MLRYKQITDINISIITIMNDNNVCIYASYTSGTVNMLHPTLVISNTCPFQYKASVG